MNGDHTPGPQLPTNEDLMTGHATAAEAREIESREATLDRATSPVGELLELALLYLEPAHREDEAIELLESIVARHPQHAEARVWLAYALLHFGMDQDSLARAREVVTPVLENTSHAGAAYMLLGEIGEEDGVEVAERIRLLEASVAAEPEWVNNRHDLAVAYFEAGRSEDATAQLEAALGSIRGEDPDWSLARRSYEESLTGRTAFEAEDRLRAASRELA